MRSVSLAVRLTFGIVFVIPDNMVMKSAARKGRSVAWGAATWHDTCMVRALRTLPVLLILALAGHAAAAPNFVDNNTALPGAKTDRRAPDNPTQQWTASDANFVFNALADVRAVLQRGSLDVKTFGAKGDGTTDDAAAIQAALDAAAVTSSTSAFGGIVWIPKGVYIVGSQLAMPGGVGIRGAGSEATYLKAKSTLSATSLIRNLHQDGTQEYASIEALTIDGNQAGGAVCSTAVVDLVSLFINSYVRDAIIMNGSNVGLRIAAAGTPGGAGPFLVENTWSVNNVGHGILVEEVAGNAGAFNGVVFVNVTSEHQGTGKSAIYLKGNGSSGGWTLLNTHVEMGGSATSRVGITIDGVPDVLIRGLQLLTGTPGNVTAGVLITSDVKNVRIQIAGVTDANLINPVISDLLHSTSVGAIAVPWWATPEFAFRGAPRFAPASGGLGAAFQDSGGTDRWWSDSLGVITGSSQTSAGLDVAANTADGSTGRVLALINNARTRAFGFLYPDSSFIRFRAITAGIDAWDVDNSGNFRTLQQLKLFGKVVSNGAGPSLSSCGVTPSVAANSTDFAGAFTIGTASTMCTLTFSSAFAAAPHCVISSRVATPPGYTPSTTSLVMTAAVANQTYDYICVGH